MNIEITTDSYNQRRYGRPWIARLTASDNPARPTYIWGDWIGEPGYTGELFITAEPGDIIARGQKDNRGNNTSHRFYAVNESGIGEELSKIEAFRAIREGVTA